MLLGDQRCGSPRRSLADLCIDLPGQNETTDATDFTPLLEYRVVVPDFSDCVWAIAVALLHRQNNHYQPQLT